MKVQRSKRSRQDLRRIYKSISVYSRPAARNFSRKIDLSIKVISTFPYSGLDRSDLGENIRTMISDMNIIFYEIRDDAIIILRIIDGRMDVTTEFQE